MDMTTIVLSIIAGIVTIVTAAIPAYYNSKRKNETYEHNNLVRERTLTNAVSLLVEPNNKELDTSEYETVREYIRTVDSNKVFAKHTDEMLNLMINRKILSM